jgi:hypothetical protein
MKEETRNLQKTALASKVVNPFTRALTPPFIGRRRDFYIPEVPSNLRNIPNVNMYMNVFHFPYIYKPTTSSHAKPGLLRRRLWLGFLLIRESLYLGNLHAPRPSNSKFSRFPNFIDSRFHGFVGSWLRVFTGSRLQGLRGFKIPELPRFATSELRRSKIPDLHRFATSELRRFKIPDLHWFATSELRMFRILDLHRFNLHENLFHEFRETQHSEDDKFFLNSPTLAPRGSRLTPTIRFHKNLWVLVKNVTLGTSEWTRVLRKPRNGRIKVSSWNCPPCPYK